MVESRCGAVRANEPFVLLCPIRGLVANLGERVDHHGGDRLQIAAGLGQFERHGVTVDERRAGPVLERLDATTEAGLRNAAQLRRLGEAAGVRDREEIPEPTQSSMQPPSKLPPRESGVRRDDNTPGRAETVMRRPSLVMDELASADPLRPAAPELSCRAGPGSHRVSAA